MLKFNYTIFAILFTHIASSCSNSIVEIRDNDLGYLNRSEYIFKGANIVRERHPNYVDLLKEKPTVYRPKSFIKGLFNHNVEVSWSRDIPGQNYAQNPIIFRHVDVNFSKSGKLLSHTSGQGKSYYYGIPKKVIKAQVELEK